VLFGGKLEAPLLTLSYDFIENGTESDILDSEDIKKLSTCQPKRRGSVLVPGTERSLMQNCFHAEVNEVVGQDGEFRTTVLILKINQTSGCRDTLKVGHFFTI
jgi:hypothetical protein